MGIKQHLKTLSFITLSIGFLSHGWSSQLDPASFEEARSENEGSFPSARRPQGGGDARLQAIAEDEWPSLSQITLTHGAVTPAACTLLSQKPLIHLSFLDLSFNNLGDVGAQDLSKSNLPCLIYLNLSKTGLGDSGLQAIVPSKWGALEAIILDDNFIGDAGVEAIASSPWNALKMVGLRNNRISDRGALAFSKRNFPHLRSLNLSENPIGNEGAVAVSQGQWPKLKSLYMFGTLIGNEGAVALSQGQWPKLKFLLMGKTQIAGMGAAALIQAEWPNLRELALSYNFLGDLDIKTFSKMKGKLQALILNNTHITNEGAVSLIDILDTSKLTFLSLRGNQITNEWVRAAKEKNWDNLKELDLAHTGIDDVGAKALMEVKFRPYIYLNLQGIDLNLSTKIELDDFFKYNVKMEGYIIYRI